MLTSKIFENAEFLMHLEFFITKHPYTLKIAFGHVGFVRTSQQPFPARSQRNAARVVWLDEQKKTYHQQKHARNVFRI